MEQGEDFNEGKVPLLCLYYNNGFVAQYLVDRNLVDASAAMAIADNSGTIIPTAE